MGTGVILPKHAAALNVALDALEHDNPDKKIISILYTRVFREIDPLAIAITTLAFSRFNTEIAVLCQSRASKRRMRNMVYYYLSLRENDYVRLNDDIIATTGFTICFINTSRATIRGLSADYVFVAGQMTLDIFMSLAIPMLASSNVTFLIMNQSGNDWYEEQLPTEAITFHDFRRLEEPIVAET